MTTQKAELRCFYELHTARSQWGDYGTILINGMCRRADDETIMVSRTGSFIPPITFPFGAIIVTDAFRNELEASGLVGLTFHEVVKELIVELPWEKWDHGSDDPAEIPSSGEPEDYILDKPHSTISAMRMGTIWEARSPRLVACTSLPGVDNLWTTAIRTSPEVFQGIDFFRTIDEFGGLIFVSARAKEWLSQKVSNWVSFKAVPLISDH